MQFTPREPGLLDSCICQLKVLGHEVQIHTLSWILLLCTEQMTALRLTFPVLHTCPEQHCPAYGSSLHAKC